MTFNIGNSYSATGLTMQEFNSALPDRYTVHLKGGAQVESVSSSSSEEGEVYSPTTETAEHEQLLNYDDALLVLNYIVADYDLLQADQTPLWSDALSLQILDVVRELAQADTLSSRRWEVIRDAKIGIQKLVKEILIDPVELGEPKPLVKTVIYDGLFMEEEFAKLYLEYCGPAKTPLRTHDLALEIISWVAIAQRCIDNEKLPPEFNGKEKEHPAPQAPAAINLFDLIAFGGGGAPLPQSAAETAALWESLSPGVGAKAYLENCMKGLRDCQAAKCSSFSLKKGIQEMLINAELRKVEADKRVEKLAGMLKNHLESTNQRIAKNNESQREELAVVRKEAAEIRIQHIEMMEKQIALDKQLIETRRMLRDAEARQQWLQFEVQRLQDRLNEDSDDDGCSIM